MQLLQDITTHLSDHIDSVTLSDIPTIILKPKSLLLVAETLRDHSDFLFDTLIDVCGVDYQDYGISHWRTEQTTSNGFSRGVNEEGVREIPCNFPRFVSVIHLLSVEKNHRVRLKVLLDDTLTTPSLIDIWPAANWFEREAFDLFGIIYEGHPDLRRLLTDYGFKGHPFRKDFPLIGEVEMRYDADKKRCVYEPVSIQPRTLMPKVIRRDNRYFAELDITPSQ